MRSYAVFFFLALIISASAVSAINFDWFKVLISGNAVSSDRVCGAYALSTPQDAVASSIISSSFDASKVIDGNTNTHWIGNNSLPYPKWVYVNLGSVRCVNELQLYFSQVYVPITFDIEVSDDADAWSVLIPNITVSEGGTYVSYDLGESKTQFIRIHETAGPRTYGTLSEVKVNSASYQIPSVTTSNGSSVPACVGGDRDYDSKGFITVADNSGSQKKYYDTCFSDTGLYEQSCSGGDHRLEEHTCAGKCYDGACVPNSFIPPVVSAPGDLSSLPGSIADDPTAKCGEYDILTPKDAVASSQFNNYRASNVIDDNPETHWFGDPNEAYPKWIYVDLGNVKCVRAVELNAFVWDAPVETTLEVSSDGRTWTEVASSFTLNEGGRYIRKDFAEIRARYVRVNELSSQRTYGSLSEFKVDGASILRRGGDELSTLKVLLKSRTTGAAIANMSVDITGPQNAIKETDDAGSALFTDLVAGDYTLNLACPA